MKFDKVQIEKLRREVTGDIVLKGEPNYDPYRFLLNRDEQVEACNQPGVIFAPRSVRDIQYALRFARANQLPIAVRGGGHSFSPASSTNGGVLIHMGIYMRATRVDIQEKTIWFQGGCFGRDVDAACQEYNMMFPVGAISHTGVGGLVGCGGLSICSRWSGLAVDNLLEVEIVTADAEHIIASADNEHADLFWALRGAAPAFGVVVAFKGRLQPFPHGVGEYVAGSVIFEGKYMKQILRVWCDIYNVHADASSRNMTVVLLIRSLPTGEPVVIVEPWYFGTSVEDARVALRPFFEIAEPIQDMLCLKTHEEIQRNFDEHYPTTGYSMYVRSRGLAPGASLNADAIDDVLEQSRKKVGSLSPGIYLEPWGHRINECQKENPTSFGSREDFKSAIMIFVHGYQNTKERNVGKVELDKLWEVVTPSLMDTSYQNYNTDDQHLDQISEQDEAQRRLVEIKKRYDPENVFKKGFLPV